MPDQPPRPKRCRAGRGRSSVCVRNTARGCSDASLGKSRTMQFLNGESASKSAQTGSSESQRNYAKRQRTGFAGNRKFTGERFGGRAAAQLRAARKNFGSSLALRPGSDCYAFVHVPTQSGLLVFASCSNRRRLPKIISASWTNSPERIGRTEWAETNMQQACYERENGRYHDWCRASFSKRRTPRLPTARGQAEVSSRLVRG